jgi:hypothetical protein
MQCEGDGTYGGGGALSGLDCVSRFSVILHVAALSYISDC